MAQLFFTLACAVLASCSAQIAMAKQQGRPDRPNVVLLLTDDLGWQDLKCYDIDEPTPYDTPFLDAFAKKGVMFWQAYSPAPTCSPSRCAIMSGHHPARAQKTHVVGGHPPYARSTNTPMMDPWYSGRMPADTFTLARAMKTNGYTTGHVGKWHIAINHNAYPQPKDVGFDFTRSDRGAHRGQGMANRLAGFATDAEDDPYRLDTNGFPFHQNSQDAMDFVDQHKAEPFFLYYCTWLVHAPIITRNEALLNKYATRMGVDPARVNPTAVPGQNNPFYGAMVESLDYYVGQLFAYLDATEDPRWPGHKLSENTYVIFTSDNGGMEGPAGERYTDNRPLDRGKISAKEGGTRVPLLIAGPGIPAGVQTQVMANGLDFYPTILALTGTDRPDDKVLDGCDLAPLLLGKPTDHSLVKQDDGSVRDTMMWHFPHGNANESTLRVGDYKLIRNYGHFNSPATEHLELFRLYNTDAQDTRVDFEEAHNLAKALPDKTRQMNDRLTALLEEMNASYPIYNPDYRGDLPNKGKAPTVKAVQEQGGKVRVTYRDNGAKIARAQLIYTLNGEARYEEWFRLAMQPDGQAAYTAELPMGTTHYFVNLIDENQFLVSHPALKGYKRGQSFTTFALEPSE